MQKVNSTIMNITHSSIYELNHVKLKSFFSYSTVASISSVFESNKLLNDLSKSGHVDRARQLFDKMLDRDEFTWNTMINAYSNSGKLSEAKQLFNETPIKSPITWSSLITGYCQNGLENEALELFWQMQIEGQKPSQFTLGSVLRLCSKLGLLQRGQQIHGHTIKTRLDSSDFVLTGLVDMYAKCKRVPEAEYLFGSSPNRKNHVMWSAMVSGYSQNGEASKAINCFRAMRIEGVESNQFTFPGILTACGSISAIRFGSQVHNCIVHSGFGANVFVQSSLVDMYSKCGDFESAKRALESMEIDDVISWNSMIVGSVRRGFFEQALDFFEKMRSRDMKTDHFTYPSVLNCFAATKRTETAKSVHCLIVKTGFESHVPVGNALIDMYAKHGDSDWARRAFDLVQEKDIISWTSLVTCYASNGSPEKALGLFCEMRISGVYPDHFVTAGILSACADLTVLEFGRQIHANCTKLGFNSSLSVDNSLLTMYAKCGCIEEANRVFDSMHSRDVISWTALIVGYAQNGRGRDSLKFYNQMITNGTSPDFVTFIGLLFACSHAGLVEKGSAFFDSMEKTHGIKPGPEHYACMIDLLGRSGKLNEAEELLTRMDFEPDSAIWKALLAGCRVHGNVELGERAARKLLELEPSNSVPYVMLSNMYCSARRFEESAKVRRSMKSMGISKEPGFSWVETRSEVHRFVSEDRRHPRADEIYSKLGEVLKLIKEDGYVPDMSFALQDMEEESKELGIAYHSEKLAIAFALLVVPLGAPIRVFKNLRVCGDCHNAAKYVSRVFSRSIVLRDPNCFHHFREGKCSCGDYW